MYLMLYYQVCSNAAQTTEEAFLWRPFISKHFCLFGLLICLLGDQPGSATCIMQAVHKLHSMSDGSNLTASMGN